MTFIHKEAGTDIILEKVYASNFSWLEKYVLNNSGSAEDAKNIFQDGITAAWINLKAGRFTGNEEQFNAYLRQICKYKWLSHLQSAGFRNTRYEDDLSWYDAEDTSGALLERQLSEADKIKKSFNHLGEKCRKILGLYYYQNKSLTAIAESTGDTPESIKTIKYRCMMQLRKFFLAQEEDEEI